MDYIPNDSFQDGFDEIDSISNAPPRPFEQNKNKRDKRKTNKKKKRRTGLIVRNVLLIFLAIVMAVSGTGFIYYYNTLDSLNFNDFSDAEEYIADDKNQVSYEVNDADLNGGSISMDLSEGSLLNDPMVLNVLLFGADKNDGSGSRSDTMIMLSIDNRHKKLKLTSFMRDLWVYIPDYGYSKLGHAYSYGGAQLSITTIEQNFGINIDRYAIVDFSSFKSIIDILGGIDIELTDEEIDYINWQSWKNNQVDTRYEITDSAGIVHLNGRQALWYARDRGDEEAGFSGSDFDRTARQRKLLRTLAESMKSASLSQIISIVNQVGPLVTTNLKKTEITTLVANSLTYLSYDMEEYRLPSDGSYENGWHYGMSTLDVIDWDEERRDLAVFLYEELVTDTLTDYNDYSDYEEYVW